MSEQVNEQIIAEPQTTGRFITDTSDGEREAAPDTQPTGNTPIAADAPTAAEIEAAQAVITKEVEPVATVEVVPVEILPADNAAPANLSYDAENGVAIAEN